MSGRGSPDTFWSSKTGRLEKQANHSARCSKSANVKFPGPGSDFISGSRAGGDKLEVG